MVFFLFSNPTEMIPENNKPTTFFKFENLRIYYKAIDFADAILALADNCSSGNQTIQHFFNKFVDEAIYLVSSLTAESSSNKTLFINNLQNTKKSIRRCVVYNTLALKRDYIDEAQEADIRNELMELTKMVGALISSLQKLETNPEGNEWWSHGRSFT